MAGKPPGSRDGGGFVPFATRCGYPWLRLHGRTRLDDGEFGSAQRAYQCQPGMAERERFASRYYGVFHIAFLGNPKAAGATDDAGPLAVADCHQAVTGQAEGGTIDLDLHGQHLQFRPGGAIDAPAIPGNHYAMHFPQCGLGHKRYFRMLRMSFKNG